MSKRLFAVALPALLAGGWLLQAATNGNFPDPSKDIPKASGSKQTAVLAGGCFWGVEAVFDHLKGVTNVVSGFAGGEKSTAQYETVSTGRTGHAESVKVSFDPAQISFGEILKVYFAVAHDPTELNYQGPDHGTQYRSAVFYMNDEQKNVTEAYIHQLNDAHTFSRPIVTQVVPYRGFYAAEDYHQHYLESHQDQPYIVYNDLPKLRALKNQFPQMCKR